MNDRIKNWLLGLATAVCITSGGVALNMWSDWKEWKAYKEAMKESRMATLEMEVKADKELFGFRIDALNTRFGEMSARECK